MSWRSVPDWREAQRRLGLIFSGLATPLSNPLAGKAIAALIYVDAIVDDDAALTNQTRLAAPRHCLLLSEQVIEQHQTPEERELWWSSAVGGSAKRRVQALERSWDLQPDQWAADNSREPLRDETFAGWEEQEAMRQRSDLPKTSPAPRWALTAPFADLFDPSLLGDELEDAVDAWQRAHMSENIKYRVDARHRREKAAAGVTVRLPGTGQIVALEASESSEIVRGVIEGWAPLRLRDAEVLALSEPGNKVPDRARLEQFGIIIDEGDLVPDVFLVDIGPDQPEFWIVEVVASGGPVDERRRTKLRTWAEDQRLPVERCYFLSAFVSRNSAMARKHLMDLAVDTYAWFADEPDRELSWRELRS